MPDFGGPSDDEYPMPEFYPMPPFPFGFPDFLSGEHQLLPPPMPEEEAKGRQKRESLVETYDVSSVLVFMLVIKNGRVPYFLVVYL